MNNLIKESYEIANKFDRSLNGIQFEKTDKYLIPVLFYSIALEHHRAIILLIEKNLIGSASSLLRCQFESYVKGLWFWNCGKEKDFKSFRKDKFNPMFKTLVSDTEEKCGEGISKPKSEYWGTLNSLTHSGTAQLSRRFDGNNVGSNYDEGFTKDTLNFANNYALLSCGQLAKLSDNPGVQKCVISISQELNIL